MITGLKRKLDYSDYARIPPDGKRYEILLSPSTRDHDRTVKARRYAALGIRHYWLVDPEGSRLECYRAEAGAYALVVQGEGDAALSHPDWPGLALPLADLWRAPAPDDAPGPRRN